MVQDEPAEALQSIAGIVLGILLDRKKAVPEGLPKAAALLHDAALLVRHISRLGEAGSDACPVSSCIVFSSTGSHCCELSRQVVWCPCTTGTDIVGLPECGSCPVICTCLS